MPQPTIQFRSHTERESSISIESLQTGSANSYIFRNILISSGYLRFDAKKIKGDFCYDAYTKEFMDQDKLKYTIYCYCYDLKQVIEDPELFEFTFEVQLESDRGILGIESIQWDFTNPLKGKENLHFFEDRIEKIWQLVGQKLFPC